MCPTHIAFFILKKLKFTWTDTFEDVENAELKQLIIKCRDTLHSLKAELAARQNPWVDTKLEDCYARLQKKAQTIKNMRALSNKNRVSLKKAGTFLKALRSDHINSSQTCETCKSGAIYEQLLWLISRVADPAYALLLICSVTRCTVKRLNSFQSAVLVKCMAQYYNSLSNCALEEKANEFDLCKTSVNLFITWWHWLICTGFDAIFLLEQASEKRKCGQSDNRVLFIAWTDSVSVSFNKSSSFNICNLSWQVKQKVKVEVNLLNSYYPDEVNGLTPLKTDFNSGILTPNSNTSNDDDKNANLTVSNNNIDCSAVVEPQNQVAAFNQPSLRSHNRLQNGNWSLANEAIFKDVESCSLICEDETHNFDSTDLITEFTIDLVVSSTWARNLLNTETLMLICSLMQ